MSLTIDSLPSRFPPVIFATVTFPGATHISAPSRLLISFSTPFRGRRSLRNKELQCLFLESDVPPVWKTRVRLHLITELGQSLRYPHISCGQISDLQTPGVDRSARMARSSRRRNRTRTPDRARQSSIAEVSDPFTGTHA